jgi:hypothetical protein
MCDEEEITKPGVTSITSRDISEAWEASLEKRRATQIGVAPQVDTRSPADLANCRPVCDTDPGEWVIVNGHPRRILYLDHGTVVAILARMRRTHGVFLDAMPLEYPYTTLVLAAEECRRKHLGCLRVSIGG